ncbi:rhodanese-like domain-containing protein [Paenibacillus sp. DXFW5]|uniref:Rhodanese-like domain-containing protein n=1 Tax=Paenibacillus rhizolycopersici TaxID=2780073 RepID=A0ABS2H4E2_9BACL|nr:rhodanese-like domain-containing protein [Paenibacillus rhizolycopersici]MBM6996320.1 rhodanese-like domain-containing protein [Paenibacillus rhizolycopersici]
MAFKTTTPHEVAARLNKGETLSLLDVREQDEWMEGHVAVAKHIPLGELDLRLNEFDPNHEMIVICRSGNRSRMACEFLSERGFHVVNMTGGLNAWTSNLVRD